MKVYVNGKIVPESGAKLSVFDRAFLYGDGVFETMRSYAGTVFRLDEHINRLFASAKAIDLKIPLARPQIKNVILRLLKINRLGDAYIRMAVSRGEGRVGLDARTAKSSNVVIITKKFTPYPRHLYEKGLSVAISSARANEGSPLSRIKSINYLNNIIARIEAQKKGYNDALLLNNKGEVSSGAVSNIFIIRGQKLATPSLESGALAGVTRAEIIKIAPRAGLKVKEKRISARELMGADEAFFTNTLMEVMPVTGIGRKKIGNGRVGRYTTAFQDLLQDRIKKEKIYERKSRGRVK